MEVKPKTLRIYQQQNGDLPFVKWIKGLRDLRGKQKIQARVDRARSGNLGDHGTVGEGVTELRLHLAQDIESI